MSVDDHLCECELAREHHTGDYVPPSLQAGFIIRARVVKRGLRFIVLIRED